MLGKEQMVKSVSLIRKLLVIQMTGVLISGLLCSYNSVFSALYFITDIICLFNIIIELHMKKMKVVLCKNNVGIICSILFLLYVTLSFFWSNYDWYNAIARYRYILVAVISLHMTLKYLDDLTFSKMIDIMTGLMYVNLALCAYQKIVMGLHPDFCNGIFGFISYANAIEGMYCLVMAIFSIIYYIDGVWNAIRSGFMLLTTCVVCALAEIKLFYVMLVIAVFLILLIKAIKDNSYKKAKKILGIVIAIIAVLFIAYRILAIIMPQNLRVFQSLSNALFYEERTTYAGRTNTISFISEHQFNYDSFRCLFGDGLGYSAYDYIYELGKVFSEQGYLGVFLITLMLIGTGIQKLFRKKITSIELFIFIYGIMMLISVVVWNVTFTRATGFVFLVLGFQNVNYVTKKKERY